jgi:ABC-type transport system involved in cytochrome c biogenesis permease subunit
VTVEVIDTINSIAWVLANLVLAYTALALVIFVIMYYALFDPRATTGGKLIFRFMLSLVGIVGLVFVGIFVDPSMDRGWGVYPADVEPWRPVLRLIIYGYVAFTITSLAALLVRRKWRPNSLKIAPAQDLVKVRHPTTEIPVVDPSDDRAHGSSLFEKYDEHK